MLVKNDHILLHSTRYDPTHQIDHVRFFASPSGPIEPITGQPWKPYFGTCIFDGYGGVAEITGALVLPKSSLGPLREMGRALGYHQVWFQRWDEVTRTILPPTVINL